MLGSSCGSGPIRPRWNGVTSVKLLQRDSCSERYTNSAGVATERRHAHRVPGRVGVVLHVVSLRDVVGTGHDGV